VPICFYFDSLRALRDLLEILYQKPSILLSILASTCFVPFLLWIFKLALSYVFSRFKRKNRKVNYYKMTMLLNIEKHYLYKNICFHYKFKQANTCLFGLNIELKTLLSYKILYYLTSVTWLFTGIVSVIKLWQNLVGSYCLFRHQHQSLFDRRWLPPNLAFPWQLLAYHSALSLSRTLFLITADPTPIQSELSHPPPWSPCLPVWEQHDSNDSLASHTFASSACIPE
jgi:hypothetical protein